MSAPVFKIAPGIQSYDWGKRGSASLAAQFASESVPDFSVDEKKTYAELWMGTHPTLPSRTAKGTLKEHLAANPSFIGTSVTKRFPDAASGALPFLFKVLSIGTALSIQAHPNKTLAERLHKERPDVYKDDNHKPEMAIALTPFRAFLNFLPIATVLLHLLTVPELAGLVPKSAVEALAKSLSLPLDVKAVTAAAQERSVEQVPAEQKDALKAVFDALMSADSEAYGAAVDALAKRYKAGKDIAPSELHLVDIALLLNEQYPRDVGVLCVFLLNIVDCEVGEAIFLGADLPHAYISGDIIECMATSDNVVRAGLTPKLRDVPTLISMLTYQAGPADRQFLKSTEFNRDPNTVIYDPPIDEFSVLRVQLAKDELTTNRAIDGPSIAIVTAGEAIISWAPMNQLEIAKELIVTRGDVVFLAAGIEYKWHARQNTEVFRAFVEA